MSTPIKITTPVPSVEETAHLLGVSPKRARELVEIARNHNVASRSGPIDRFVETRKVSTKRGRTKARQF